jgi:large repetitive protein
VLHTGPGASFTVAAWVFMTSFPANGGFATAASQGGAFDSTFFCSTPALPGAGRSPGWPATPTAARTPPSGRCRTARRPLNTWTYLTGVFNGATGQMTLYVNGAARGTATDPTPFDSGVGDHFVIGRAQFDGASTDFFAGAMSDVEAFQTALSPTQAVQLYTEASG